VDASTAQRSCLTDDQVLKLARLGVQLEKMFGSPRDIEFAVKQVGIDVKVPNYFIDNEKQRKCPKSNKATFFSIPLAEGNPLGPPFDMLSLESHFDA